ncbi:MAG TPA: hypothetical protein VMW08_08000 [Acidimicrobiales bacterium]|nr:hypothetical protein [Acidimicrobiales bacterium]
MTRASRLVGAAFVALLLFSACGGDDAPSESEAIDLLTTELVAEVDLPEADARCVSTAIVDDIGVDGLEEIGLATGGSGEFTDLSEEEQTRLFDLITEAFGTCEIELN